MRARASTETAGIPTQRLWGVHNGAGFRIEVPFNWNGSLVMWAHGFRGTGLELTVDNPALPATLRALLTPPACP